MIKRKNFFTALICVILALVTALSLAFSGCATYTPPQEGGDPSTPVDPITPTPSDPTDKDEGFTVQLMMDDRGDISKFTEELYEQSDGNGGVHQKGWVPWSALRVQWTDVETNARYTAPLDENGKAVCAGLDGDYKVTITSVRTGDIPAGSIPTGFTYEPNENFADNISQSIEVTLYKILPLGVRHNYLYMGNDSRIKYPYYSLDTTGAYRVVLGEKNDEAGILDKDEGVMIAFTPQSQGMYTVTTLADVTANLINPVLHFYTGQVASHTIYYESEQDGGGAENTYTKNIRWEYNMPQHMVGNTLFFRIFTTSIDGVKGYPVTLDFHIKWLGDYVDSGNQSVVVPVTEDFTKTPSMPEGEFTWSARKSESEGLGLKLDQKRVMLNNEKGRGGKTQVILNTQAGYFGRKVNLGATAQANDGKYYRFNYDAAKDEYTLTEQWVKTDRSGDAVTAFGKQASPNDGYYYYADYDSATGVYTLSDRLYMAINKSNNEIYTSDGEGNGFTDSRMNFRSLKYGDTIYNYQNFVKEYRKHCEQGCYPVNEELMLFAQRFAVAERLFNDGAGMAETASLDYVDKDGNPVKGGYSSDEDSMWLFLCGYFKQA